MSKVIEELKREAQPIIDLCKEIIDGELHICSRSVNKETCSVYAFPEKKWRIGDCPMVDSVLIETEADKKKKKKVRVGQQKQKKF